MIHQQMECLKTVTGGYPVGWYYGRISPYSRALVWEVHKELKAPLLWEADTYAEDLPYWVDVPAEKNSKSPEGMLMIPYRSVPVPQCATILTIFLSYDCNDLKFCAPHGFGSVGAFTEHLKSAFDVLYSEGENGSPGMMTVALHCRISGKPARAKALSDFVEYISAKQDVWVARRKDIAVHFREKFPYKPGHVVYVC
jgi:peptidoglycan/xylan/chitin deacetylase (PgdA/CDA1 family)